MPHPLRCSKGARVFSHEEQTETVLWQKGSTLRHVQLLSEKTAAVFGSGEERLRESSCGGAHTVRVFAGWVCADAGARAPVTQRAGQRYALESDTGIEAESVESDAWKEASELEEPVRASVFRGGTSAETVLAKEVL